MVDYDSARDDLAATIAQNIREKREALGLSLGALADRSDTSKGYIWELENKKPPHHPSVDKLSKIAAALGTTVDDLMGQANEGRLSPEDRVFLARFLGLSTVDRARIRKIVTVFCESQ